MFFEITNKDLSVTQIGEVIAEKKKNGLTPEDAIEILGMTNHYTHIKSVITEINKLSTEYRLAYKDFVVGAVDSREVSDENYGQLLRLADEGNYYLEFRTSNMKEKCYEEKTAQAVEGAENGMIYIKDGDGFDFRGRGLRVEIEGRSYLSFYDEDLDQFDYLKLRRPGDINLGRQNKYDEYGILLSDDTYYFKMPRRLVVEDFKMLWFECCDLSKTEELNISSKNLLGEVFGDVYFKDVYFPKKLDLSKCHTAICSEYECLDELKEVKFRNKEQADKFFKGTTGFNGKIIYADEPQNPVSQVVRGNDIDR